MVQQSALPSGETQGGRRCFLAVAERHAVRCQRESVYLMSRTSLPFSL
jgi:hypothetical protein